MRPLFRKPMKTRLTLHSLFLLPVLAIPSGCSDAKADSRTGRSASTGRDLVATSQESAAKDAPLAEFRRELLQLAFQAASALPMDPHKKSRGKAQEIVALACLDLDQPTMAREFATHIADWRRGAVLADYAHWMAVHGDAAEAKKYVEFADQIARDVGRDATDQEWRRDTIRNKMARALAAAHDLAEAQKVAATIDPSSGQAFDSGWAATASSRADHVTAEMLDKELSTLDDTLLTAASGQAFNVVAVYVRLYDKFYADEAQRTKIGKRVQTRDSKLPPDMHVSGLVELARVAAKHGDRENAKRLLADVREFLRTTELGLEYTLGLVPVVATVSAKAGELDAAKAELADGLRRYHENRDSFRQTKRAEVLRPFAEGFHAVGDDVQAAEIYELVLEEGVENPNSRPRAHDLSETCVSMARHGFEPNDKLKARIRQILNGLGDPW